MRKGPILGLTACGIARIMRPLSARHVRGPETGHEAPSLRRLARGWGFSLGLDSGRSSENSGTGGPLSSHFKPGRADSVGSRAWMPSAIPRREEYELLTDDLRLSRAGDGTPDDLGRGRGGGCDDALRSRLAALGRPKGPWPRLDGQPQAEAARRGPKDRQGPGRPKNVAPDGAQSGPEAIGSHGPGPKLSPFRRGSVAIRPRIPRELGAAYPRRSVPSDESS